MTQGQKIAFKKMHEGIAEYKKANNIKWWNFIFPNKEFEKFRDMVNYHAWSIANYPQYIGEDGESLNEVEVDARMGKDMTKYGFKDSADYFHKTANLEKE